MSACTKEETKKRKKGTKGKEETKTKLIQKGGSKKKLRKRAKEKESERKRGNRERYIEFRKKIEARTYNL